MRSEVKVRIEGRDKKAHRTGVGAAWWWWWGDRKREGRLEGRW